MTGKKIGDSRPGSRRDMQRSPEFDQEWINAVLKEYFPKACKPESASDADASLGLDPTASKRAN